LTDQSADERDWAVSEVHAEGVPMFGISYGTDAESQRDPVAATYAKGSLDPVYMPIQIATAVLSPGDRVLDLGAHLGGFALAASALGCEVLAVEASPRNAALLKLSVAHNQFDKLTVVHAAVSDERGSVEFAPDGPFGHVATPKKDVPAVTVPAVRVDDLLEELGWDSIQFVKLDVEGSEVQALRGMPRVLSDANAPLVFFESNTHTLGFFDQTGEDLKAEFRRWGYVVYSVEPLALRAVKPGQEQSETVVDYLAAKVLPPALAPWTRRHGGRAASMLRRLHLL